MTAFAEVRERMCRIAEGTEGPGAMHHLHTIERAANLEIRNRELQAEAARLRQVEQAATRYFHARRTGTPHEQWKARESLRQAVGAEPEPPGMIPPWDAANKRST